MEIRKNKSLLFNSRTRILFVFILFSSILFAQEPNKIREITFENLDLIWIGGDFDGNGREEGISLRYKFHNSKNQKITIEYNDSIQLYNSYCEFDPEIILEIDNKKINALSLGKNCKISGLYQIVNIGDINDNKGDEIAIWVLENDKVSDYFQIYTYQNKAWILLGSFKAHDKSGTPNIDNMTKRNSDRVYKWYIDEVGKEIEIK